MADPVTDLPAVSAVAASTADSSAAPAIHIRGLSKWFGDFQVLKDIDLDVAKGERIVVCGPSGSGKSTLIRCINRLEHHQQGTIVVNGTTLDDNLKHIDTVRSEVGMVFQHFNLFPHLTIAAWSVLVAAQPAWDEPTLGVIAGDTLFYVANSQWGSFDQAGQPRPEARLRPPVIERLLLD
jgi:ABC-type branched-subunit amino acid transport system ATPase component